MKSLSIIDPSIPLVDLHRHLDGNIKPELLWKLAKQKGIELGVTSIEALREKCQVTRQSNDLMAFLSKLDVGVSVLSDVDACYQVAYENIRDMHLSRLDYAELRFSPRYMASPHQLDMDALIEAVAAGVADGVRDFDVKAKLIGILSRTYGHELCMAELQAILRHQQVFCAVDLAGDELGFPAKEFIEHFNLVREAGLNVTVHAGEAAGSESVRDAIELLGATRIGHAVSAAKDPELMDKMAERGIVIESCPTSNFHTAAIDNLANHPLPEFIKFGIPVTINTDDPGVSAIDLLHEYAVAKDVIGLSKSQLHSIQANGTFAAFLTEAEKQTLLKRVSLQKNSTP